VKAHIPTFVRGRPRLLICTAFGAALTAVLPEAMPLTTRILIGWDAGILMYLIVAGTMMAGSEVAQMRERAKLEDDSATAFLVVNLGAAMASFVAIAAELHGIHEAPAGEQTFRLGLAGLTIFCTWFFFNLIFALHYAHDYYGDDGARRGLTFPGRDDPDYFDFLYFSFTIGAAAQTSDVIIVSRRMRRIVLAHTVLAFLFNTTVLAFAINVGAGIL
jgi:uncharacterized membrane protein